MWFCYQLIVQEPNLSKASHNLNCSEIVDTFTYILIQEKPKLMKESVIKFKLNFTGQPCTCYVDEWVNGTTMKKFSCETAIHLINRHISREKLSFIKTALNEMNLRNQQNFFSRYAARIMRKKREPCNKTTSQELLSWERDKEIPLAVFSTEILLCFREEFLRAKNERELRLERDDKMRERERERENSSISFFFVLKQYFKFCMLNIYVSKYPYSSLR